MTFSKNTSQFPHHFVHAEQKTLNASHTKWTLSGPDDDEIVQNARTENGATGCFCLRFRAEKCETWGNDGFHTVGPHSSKLVRKPHEL